ncbi:hypothetical protein C2S51_011648 [Perilla frutescens var. frutescens]|nr:hypothetical protein C2S51_011648 [Perilla frutescens var. frutescens]
MKILLIILCALLISDCALANSNSSYDYSASIDCLAEPPAPQYGGGLVANPDFDSGLDDWDVFGGSKIMLRKNMLQGNFYMVAYNRSLPTDGFSHIFYLQKDYLYTFSAWFQINEGSEIVSAFIRAPNGENTIVGSVIAKSGCWSMLKGGFTSTHEMKVHLFFTCSNTTVELWIDGVSLKQFTKGQWQFQQHQSINQIRKRQIKIEVRNEQGEKLQGATINLTQTRPHFPIGCGSTAAIIDNRAYQDYFASRFTAATPDNEMKWYFTEGVRGRENYTAMDAMAAFFKKNRIAIRGHNILWDSLNGSPQWIKDLRPNELVEAAVARIASVVSRYSGDVVAWDVVNENLHNSYFEDILGENASAVFYHMVRAMDLETPLFLNDYNTLEYPNDMKAIPSKYVEKIREIQRFIGNENMAIHIGLQGHFILTPNVSHMRAALDILGATNMPIWLTELDTKKGPRQSVELEDVMREAFAHPSVEGIIVWGGWKATACNETCGGDELPRGCAQMCLTDNKFKNSEAGDVVDKLMQEWRSVEVVGITDKEGFFWDKVFLGEYSLTISHPSLPNSLHKTFNVTKANAPFLLSVAL